jgi:hypothetical protein
MFHSACFSVACFFAYFTSASPCRSELPLSVSIAGHSHSRCYRSVSPSRLTIAPTDAESAVAAASSGVQPSSPCGSGATRALCEASCTRQPCEAPSRRPRALSRKLSRGCSTQRVQIYARVRLVLPALPRAAAIQRADRGTAGGALRCPACVRALTPQCELVVPARCECECMRVCRRALVGRSAPPTLAAAAVRAGTGL